MKLASEIWKGSLPEPAATGIERPRVGIAGIAIESSTFSQHVTYEADFRILREQELLDNYDFLAAGRGLREAAEWVPLLTARSVPGGPVDPPTYRRLRDEIVALILQHGPFDGFFLDIHGAMSTVGMTDAEEDLARAVRGALGDETLVSASMDLHGNVSPDFLSHLDLVTCYRMAPHEDESNTRERAVHNLLLRLRGEGGVDPVARRPLKAWVRVPVLLPGEKTSTRVEPAKSLYGRLPGVENREGVLDASIWVGYAWADEPRCHAAVVVTGDDEGAVTQGAEELATAFWEAREDFTFVGPSATFAEAIDLALQPSAGRPYLISDSGDNPTAGGNGDSSWTLRALLEDPRLANADITIVHASTFDAAAVAECVAVGVGQRVRVSVGGLVDTRSAKPAEVDGIVESIVHGDPQAGTQVVLRHGALRIVVTERRKPFHHLRDFEVLGLDPRNADVIVVKIGYLEPELFELANGWTLALTPGGVDQHMERLNHQHLQPGTWPFDKSDPSPNLRPVVTKGRHRC